MKKTNVYHFAVQYMLAAVFLLNMAPVTAQTAEKTLASERLPNIIYIYADDLGYGELGCYGQHRWLLHN